MGVNDKRSNDDRGDTNICNNGQKKFRVSICREDSMETKEIAFGIDGISINFVVLTTILIPICILVS